MTLASCGRQSCSIFAPTRCATSDVFLESPLSSICENHLARVSTSSSCSPSSTASSIALAIDACISCFHESSVEDRIWLLHTLCANLYFTLRWANGCPFTLNEPRYVQSSSSITSRIPLDTAASIFALTMRECSMRASSSTTVSCSKTMIISNNSNFDPRIAPAKQAFRTVVGSRSIRFRINSLTFSASIAAGSFAERASASSSLPPQSFTFFLAFMFSVIENWIKVSPSKESMSLGSASRCSRSASATSISWYLFSFEVSFFNLSRNSMFKMFESSLLIHLEVVASIIILGECSNIYSTTLHDKSSSLQASSIVNRIRLK
mmetsp:Transcript_25332/g.36052  ORF Transcript_25332/g.36052 Transcript_25332/m.36052 type:complete len:321 (-) Transcript_25332:40-1002(-)